MKKFILAVILMASVAQTQATEYPFTYNCIPQHDNIYEDIKITVYSETRFLINEQDDGYIDEEYKPTEPNKNFVRIKGYLQTIGDGYEGYTVNLLIEKNMLKGSTKGFMKYHASGPDGFYGDGLECTKL